MLIVAAVSAAVLGRAFAQQPPALLRHAPQCGATLPAGALIEPPQIDVGALPLDDLGRHELIMRVVQDGPRFCFLYMLNGAPQNVAPTLRMHRGDRFAIRLVNEISGPAPGAALKASALAPCMPAHMADATVTAYSGYLNHTIYARTMNMRPLDVNLHLHGFEGPPEQENVFLSTLSTPAHACEYDVTIPSTQPPGTYFYHPHAHGMSGPEVSGGLSGMWIVQPDRASLAAVEEHDIVLRQRLPLTAYDPAKKQRETAEVAALAPVAVAHERAMRIVPPMLDYDPFNPPAWPSFIPLRAGNERLDPHGCGFFAEAVFTVNGADTPENLTVQADKPQLLRVLNALPNGPKFLRLRDASGAVQTLHVVGRDGIPVSNDDAHPLAHYLPMTGVLLGPTMRADILLTVKPGQTLTLYSDRYCPGAFGAELLKHDLLIISAAASTHADPHQSAVASTPLDSGDSRAVQLLRYARFHPKLVHRRALTYTQYDLPNPDGKGRHVEFYITETSNRDFHEQEYWPSFPPGRDTPSHADIVVRQGSVEEWYLWNATPEGHTFHIHQMAFAAEDETPVPVMLDTVVVPAGRMLSNPGDPNFALIKPSRTRILLDFRHVPRGEFVYHCHMLFHEDNGMMGVIRVI
ncbi:MAG TPA: multicopper oxidase domain-containing protein [Candidatus Baltobacteraceae bacterium]|nr:multicopper oxidase domain-containing protein [Candidatus Baltobacteraceae bacterium]